MYPKGLKAVTLPQQKARSVRITSDKPYESLRNHRLHALRGTLPNICV